MPKNIPPEIDTWNELNAELAASINSIAQSTPEIEEQRRFFTEQIEAALSTIENDLNQVNTQLDTLYDKLESLQEKKQMLEEADNQLTEQLNKDPKNADLLVTQKTIGDEWAEIEEDLNLFEDHFESKEDVLIKERTRLEIELKQNQDLLSKAKNSPSLITELENSFKSIDLDSITIEDDDSLLFDELYSNTQDLPVFSSKFKQEERAYSPVGVDEIQSIVSEDFTDIESVTEDNNPAEHIELLQNLVQKKESALQNTREEINDLESQKIFSKHNINKIILGQEDKKQNLTEKKQCLEQEKSSLMLIQEKNERTIDSLNDKIKHKNETKEERGQYRPLLDLLKSVQHFIFRALGFKTENETFKAEREHVKKDNEGIESKLNTIYKTLKTIDAEMDTLSKEIKQIKQYQTKMDGNEKIAPPLTPLANEVLLFRDNFLQSQKQQTLLTAQVCVLEDEIADLDEEISNFSTIVSADKNINQPTFTQKNSTDFRVLVQKGRQEMETSLQENNEYSNDKAIAPH